MKSPLQILLELLSGREVNSRQLVKNDLQEIHLYLYLAYDIIKSYI